MMKREMERCICKKLLAFTCSRHSKPVWIELLTDQHVVHLYLCLHSFSHVFRQRYQFSIQL